MRLITFLLLSGFTLSACAGKTVPADLQPLPPPPPYEASGVMDKPAVAITNKSKQSGDASGELDKPAVTITNRPRHSDDASDDLGEPGVTITKQTELTIEEYRAGNRLYMIKVTPKHGPAYYLVDDQGNGKFARQESLDSGFRPPRWVIHRF
jgi:hypothetical protein